MYLLCPKCGHLLTGSASPGRNGIYYYYDCKSSCGARFKAEAANDLFTKELRKLVPRAGMAESYKVVVNAAYKAQAKDQSIETKEITDQLNEAQNDIAKPGKLLLKEEIDASDYKAIKAESERKIMLLEAKLMDVAQKTNNIESLLDNAVKFLVTLDQLYKDGGVKKKPQIICSIVLEKLTFDGINYRTARLNEAVKLIYTLDKGLPQNKNGQTEVNLDLSTLVRFNVYKNIQQETSGNGMANVTRELNILKKAGNAECRHTFPTILKRSGVTTEFIQEALEHADKKTTENYLDSFAATLSVIYALAKGLDVHPRELFDFSFAE